MPLNNNFEKKLRIAINIAIVIRLLLVVIIQNHHWDLNPDEQHNYEIAQNYLAGHGYSFWDYRTNNWVNSAFHSSFTVLLYQGLQVLHIPEVVYIMFIHLLSAFLYGFSALFLYRIGGTILEKKYAFWAALSYLFIPPSLYYIGPLFAYENIVVPLLIITIWQLTQLTNKKWKRFYWFIIPVTVSLSVLIRPNILPSYFVIFFILIVIALYKKERSVVSLILLTGIITTIVHIPILIKTHKQFGVYILNTQSGFELLQGHNPYARGSWRGNWREPGNPLYEYVHYAVPSIDSLNEYQESVERKKLAIAWIKQNPKQEAILCIRKVAMFFLPKNYEVLPTSQIPNPVNGLLYALAIAGFILLVYKRQLNTTWVLICVPIAGAILTCLVYFVGYRWRYYAEPFMCILAFYPVQLMYNQRKKQGNTAVGLT